jgi:hypothetical protein
MIDREDELQSIGGRPPGRRRIVVRTGLRSILLGAVAAAVAACSSKWRELESKISAGMSEAEVLELLGEPSSKVKVPVWGEQAGHVRWQWNDNLSTLATGALFPDAVPDRVLAVSFDAEGRVVAWRMPTTP